MPYYTMEYSSPVGRLVLASAGEGLTGLWMEGQKYFGGSIAGELGPARELPVFRQTACWLDRYFAGKRPEPAELPLAPIGGEFRQEVWRLLCGIPSGETLTYGGLARELCRQLGRESLAPQAVGGAVGHNPISILIPCHRVVNREGRLAPAFAFGGPDIQRMLLEEEGIEVSKEGFVDLKKYGYLF